MIDVLTVKGYIDKLSAFLEYCRTFRQKDVARRVEKKKTFTSD